MEFVFNFFNFLKEKKFNLLDIIFPPTCIICGKLNNDYICTNCEKRLKKYKKFNIIDNQKLIKDKYNINLENFRQKFYFYNNNKYYWEKLLYCFDYKGIIRKCIIKYKFNNKPYISNFFVNQILNNKKASEILKLYDIIIPVPMDKNKKLKRGYNQTELITRIISKKTGILENTNIVFKPRQIKTQSMLDKKSRKLNIKDAYLVNNTINIKNKKVILFDDIYTTGATVNEISKKLKEAGVKEILVLVIAKD